MSFALGNLSRSHSCPNSDKVWSCCCNSHSILYLTFITATTILTKLLMTDTLLNTFLFLWFCKWYSQRLVLPCYAPYVSILQTFGANDYMVTDKINDFMKLLFWELKKKKKQNDLESHLEDICFNNRGKINKNNKSYRCAICFMYIISFNLHNNW